MVKFKKLGIVLTSTAFSIGVLSPVAQASVPVNEASEKIEIQVAATDTKVSKNELIKKFRTLFPTEFNFLTDKDFQLERNHFYRDDETIRHGLSFDKVVDGKNIYGSISFKGDTLELESFYYQPANSTDALFPAKYSEEEAQKIANNFLKKLPNSANYQLQEDSNGYDYYMSGPLSRPISYSFTYLPVKNGVPISDHGISISVLGNGVIENVYSSSSIANKATFDSQEQKKSETDILKQMRDNLSVELRYNIGYDFATDEREVKLVYVPIPSFYGVHALTGQWQTVNGFTTQAPKAQALEKLSAQPLAPKRKGITAEEAEALGKSLIKVDLDKGKLTFDSANERENEAGETVYSLHYMYWVGSSGSGITIELNKNTGEITQFYNYSNDLIETEETASGITQEVALSKAMDYLKEWAPSYLHHYAKSADSYSFNEYNKSHNFTFPRVVNGIAVTGDEINIDIGTDGSLQGLNINHQDIQNWPSTNKVIAPDVAKTSFSEALKPKLQYVKQDSEDKDKQHYNLVYAPTYDGVLDNQIDVKTGEFINSSKPDSDTPKIAHPTAADELNYLLTQKVLEVKDPANFNADKAVSKGEALKIMMKSLTYVYSGRYMGDAEAQQSFSNIDSKHPLYAIVEQAVRMGVIEPSDNFNDEGLLTRQEFAEWSIRALNLEKAVQNSDIYKLNFADASSIQPTYAGYVALANGLGLLDAKDNKINATGNVTYADLAVSAIRLAHKVNENSGNRYYW
ncbi:YcdB/YcdC domain-containing protein [Lysinibacillus sp. NPDC096418]|uniref:YcdB/YcdC domain-containing protein n=1 Tax=Lysinibacillus sp. NPDC096418 TaxID=3364138 RepID=UPI0038078B77